MANVKRGLGRGLSALIPDAEMEVFRRVARDETISPPKEADRVLEKAIGKADKSKKVRSAASPDAKDVENKAVNDDVDAEEIIPIDLAPVTSLVAINDIEANPYQPRRFFDESELNDLALSIKEHGVIQPIVIRPSESGAKPYQLVAGERRWRASQRAEMTQIPAIIRSINDLQALELALIENVQRHDISAIDAALAYRRLSDEFHLSQEDISRRVGKSRSAVANTMRLLDLQPEIRASIEEGHLSEGHGRAILLAHGDGARRALFRRIVRDKLSVREAERLAKNVELSKESNNEKRAVVTETQTNLGATDIDFLQLTTRLEKALGARLSLRSGKKGGHILIEYSSNEELQRLVEHLSK